MKPEKIIIHHSLTKDSGTVSWDAIRRYHTQTNGWPDIGYHYGIELINNHYEILTGRMMNRAGAHTRGHNNDSLGICFVGNFDIDEPDPEIWHTGIRLVASLCEVLNISTEEIYAHREFASYKTCPGTKFNIDGFRVQVNDTLN